MTEREAFEERARHVLAEPPGSPAKSRPNLESQREARRAHCAAMLAQWERRRRLATSKVKVWARRLKATEQRIVLAASRRAEPPA